MGHTKVGLDPGEGRKSPDYSFNHGDTVDPQFVLEVAFSQSGKRGALSRLAKDYYERSDGVVKTVLTVAVNYRSPDERRFSPSKSNNRSASFSLYRGPRQVHKNKVIRDTSGEPAVDGAVELLLSDFIPDSLLSQLSRSLEQQIRTTAINIPADQMYQSMVLAENARLVRDKANREAAEQARPS